MRENVSVPAGVGPGPRTPKDAGVPLRLHLEHARSQVLAGFPLDDDTARLVAVALDRVVSRLDRADAIALRRAARLKRDDLIREMAAKFFADRGSQRATAMAICGAIKAYAAGEWRFHCRSSTCPAAIIGTHREYLWRAFRLVSSFPSSLRSIKNILDNAQK